jgi:hypothetical protein
MLSSVFTAKANPPSTCMSGLCLAVHHPHRTFSTPGSRTFVMPLSSSSTLSADRIEQRLSTGSRSHSKALRTISVAFLTSPFYFFASYSARSGPLEVFGFVGGIGFAELGLPLNLSHAIFQLTTAPNPMFYMHVRNSPGTNSPNPSGAGAPFQFK